MVITEEDLNEYRRKHNMPIPVKDAEKQRLLTENERLKAENEQLRAEIKRLRASNEWSPPELTLDKKWCRRETDRLIRKGEITPTPCEVCGSKTIHNHHPDYADPYNVRFLCPYHHYELHYKQCLEKGEDGQFFKMLMDKC